MKKYPYLFILIIALSCSDGDLQIDTLDFDDATLEYCVDPTENASNIFFKIEDNEALILELPSGVFSNNQSTTIETTTTSSIPGSSGLIYRLFSDTATNSYFCDAIPPVTPTVSEEIEASAGTVTILSIANADSTQITHTITLSDISFINANGERVTNLSVEDFGEVVIDVE